VKDVDNKGPKLTIPPDVCVQAGAYLMETISAVDVASKTGRIDPLTIYSSGNVYAIDTVYAIKQPYATFSTSPKQVTSPAYGYFKWQTACQHIRKEPYDIFFKVEDNPPITVGGGLKLVDSKIWKVRVIAPAIKGLKASIVTEGNKASLTWNAYPCALTGAKIIIYRKQGACTPAVNKLCQTGMSLPGFTEIARVDITKTAYEDAGLLKNSNYTYVLVVLFTNSKGSEDFSPMSESACVFIPTSAPLMTNVSVRKTDATAGELFVRWTRPLKLDTLIYPGPYQYVVNRADGLNGNNFVQTGLPIAKDTSMTDKGLNTASNAYRYKVDFYYTLNKQFKLLDAPSPASSVVLQGQAAVKSVKLAWTANVPWSNDYQVHRVYRESPRGSGKFNQISEVSVAGANSYTFTDQGTDFYTKDGKFDVAISPDSTYCYYVETLGTYGEGLPALALLNSSQTVCVKPQSDVNPCAPKLTLVPLACESLDKEPSCNWTSFDNSLTWVPTLSGNCDQSLASFRVYYSKDGTNFKMVGEVNALKYVHKKVDSFIGCYYVTAVSQLGKESAKSETFCQDNCPSFELPNIFSPNADGKNDVFLAMRCPRFVTQVICKIVDRNGQLVYEYKGDIAGFGWNGKDMNGNMMAPSTYFYTCDVAFEVVNTALKTKTLKGWVELVK
jgi:gliding motility-associated-like protein